MFPAKKLYYKCLTNVIQLSKIQKLHTEIPCYPTHVVQEDDRNVSEILKNLILLERDCCEKFGKRWSKVWPQSACRITANSWTCSDLNFMRDIYYRQTSFRMN